jgi:flavin reductase (DIM6/NTAB) family NADH-FMN oxidoreductase RutF
MHRQIQPAIHYWGTPVVLVSTRNPDGSTNLAPISSIWWLGWSCMLGFDASSRTVENLRREGQAVLNLASAETAAAVNRLARTTGSPRLPLHKKALGYRHVADKATAASVSLVPSVDVRAPRVEECRVQLEAEVVAVRAFGARDERLAVPSCAVELRILRVHADESILTDDDRVDPERWRPLLMSFRHLFVRGEKIEESRLAHGEESLYAPWKRRGLAGVAARTVGAMAHRRYAVGEEADHDE